MKRSEELETDDRHHQDRDREQNVAAELALCRVASVDLAHVEEVSKASALAGEHVAADLEVVHRNGNVLTGLGLKQSDDFGTEEGAVGVAGHRLSVRNRQTAPAALVSAVGFFQLVTITAPIIGHVVGQVVHAVLVDDDRVSRKCTLLDL